MMMTVCSVEPLCLRHRPTDCSAEPLCLLYIILYTVCIQQHQYSNTGLFISPSGISELDCATTNTDTAERSISLGRESLQAFCTRGLGVLAGSTARG